MSYRYWIVAVTMMRHAQSHNTLNSKMLEGKLMLLSHTDSVDASDILTNLIGSTVNV